jgi:hypothetical protein
MKKTLISVLIVAQLIIQIGCRSKASSDIQIADVFSKVSGIWNVQYSNNSSARIEITEQGILNALNNHGTRNIQLVTQKNRLIAKYSAGLWDGVTEEYTLSEGTLQVKHWSSRQKYPSDNPEFTAIGIKD